MFWIILFSLLVIIFLLFFVSPLRRRIVSYPIYTFYRSVMPVMSRTEKEAIQAGTVTWEGELFSGKPRWDKLLAAKHPSLTEEEERFLKGPVQALCRLIQDYEIVHHLHDLPESIWCFLKEQGFFGLVIPKQYGGMGFSALLHSEVITTVSGLSVTVATTISVPNSLGPAELLLHYGTDKQKNYYLPRLARGEEIPCFALTSPEAGSDASSMTDHGIVCYGEYQGQKQLGITLNWCKRYITLSPIATVIGLAFKLYDPDSLLGDKEELGITCALIPRQTKGITIGRRHFPINAPFQNGPIQGKDVFIPIDWIIGGKERAGHGWRMLMECLSAGRAITLPSMTLGGAKVASFTAGAYAKIRKQFHRSIGQFEGVADLIARSTVYTYIMDALRLLVLGSIQLGEKPAVATAIVKYHTTELGRKVGMHVMDLHGGKTICLGPKNYLAHVYQSCPIAITVEGANVLTRSMIIFGQGAIRCHPYVLEELEAAHQTDSNAGLLRFDRVLIKHLRFILSNLGRSLFHGLTAGKCVSVPNHPLKKYLQQTSRLCSAFALTSDVFMMSLGGRLKRKENLSARLGDILSHLYIISSLIKHFDRHDQTKEDLPLMQYAIKLCLYEIQTSFYALFKNHPSRFVGYVLRIIIFPWGKHFHMPYDRVYHKIADLMMNDSPTRSRLTKGIFKPDDPTHPFAQIQDALLKTIAAEPVEKILKEAKHHHQIKGFNPKDEAEDALSKKIITESQYQTWITAWDARHHVLSVDDFETIP